MKKWMKEIGNLSPIFNIFFWLPPSQSAVQGRDLSHVWRSPWLAPGVRVAPHFLLLSPQQLQLTAEGSGGVHHFSTFHKRFIWSRCRWPGLVYVPEPADPSGRRGPIIMIMAGRKIEGWSEFGHRPSLMGLEGWETPRTGSWNLQNNNQLITDKGFCLDCFSIGSIENTLTDVGPNSTRLSGIGVWKWNGKKIFNSSQELLNNFRLWKRILVCQCALTGQSNTQIVPFLQKANFLFK